LATLKKKTPIGRGSFDLTESKSNLPKSGGRKKGKEKEGLKRTFLLYPLN